MAGYPLMRLFVVAHDCMVDSSETCMPRVLITVGAARARVAPSVVLKKKGGRQRLIFDTREANHHFAQVAN